MQRNTAHTSKIQKVLGFTDYFITTFMQLGELEIAGVFFVCLCRLSFGSGLQQNGVFPATFNHFNKISQRAQALYASVMLLIKLVIHLSPRFHELGMMQPSSFTILEQDILLFFCSLHSQLDNIVMEMAWTTKLHSQLARVCS